MRILISNDDGIGAPGIDALVRAFSGAGHELTVVAPDGQRSAASHSVTIEGEIAVERREFPGAARAFAVRGTPADCVKIGLRTLAPDCEFVLTGINRGYNIGVDVLYSGTVGAAMEGALAGCPAMAVSLGKRREDHYDLAAEQALSLFEMLVRHPLPPLCMANLNIPETDRVEGLVATSLRPLRYDDAYTLARREGGVDYYRLGGWIEEDGAPGDDDLTWLQRGCATLTILSYDMAQHEQTRAWRACLDSAHPAI